MIFEDYLDEHFPDEWDTDWADAEILRDGMQYAMGMGGKRLRPLLCLKLCDGFDGDLAQARAFARAIEMYHNFTLVHDDILDKDVYRRGEKAVWMRYGLSQGINTGDGMHALAYTYLIDNADRFDQRTFVELLDMLNAADRDVMNGQSMDVSFRGRDDVTETEYIAMVTKKTGALLGAALHGAAVIADVDTDTRERIDLVGNKVGPAFQIRDDVIDIVGEKGRQRGNDIKEGKRSLIVVYALQHLDGAERDELLAILDTEKEETTDEDVARAIDLFESVGAVDEANQKAVELADEAKEILDTVSADHDVHDVQQIIDFIVERTF